MMYREKVLELERNNDALRQALLAKDAKIGKGGKVEEKVEKDSADLCNEGAQIEEKIIDLVGKFSELRARIYGIKFHLACTLQNLNSKLWNKVPRPIRLLLHGVRSRLNASL